MRSVGTVFFKKYYKALISFKQYPASDFPKILQSAPLSLLSWKSLFIRKWALYGLLSFKLLCGVLAFSLACESYAAGPFVTDGKFSVGSDGSANYSIPVVVPPGTAGMQPQLALNYGSNGGNGIVGLGWGIDGLSQISRCGSTLEQDGVMSGVTYTNTDRFCIDGQRLIATSDIYNTITKKYTTTSAYGANGTEYRTESANFAKIISYGVAGNGPAYFKVWTKSGQVIEYGNTADSAIEAQGKPTIRTWGVNKILDTKGNYISVSYTEDNANGEAYVNRIDYTGNTTSTPVLAPYANVQFTYETRPDTTTAYQAGSVLKTTKRMVSIQAYDGTTLIKNYKLTYSNTGAYHMSTTNVADGSLLVGVQECDGNAIPICKQATLLAWSVGSLGAAAFGDMQSWAGLPAGATIVATGDVNGDGLFDVAYQQRASMGIVSAPFNIGVALSNGSGFTDLGILASQTLKCVQSGNFTCNAYEAARVKLADLNGDGKADLLSVNSVSLSTGSGFSAAQAWVGLPTGAIIVAVGDVNGDGFTDVAYQKQVSAGFVSGSFSIGVALSNGSGFTDLGIFGSQTLVCSQSVSMGCDGFEQAWVELADLNGDGRADLLNVNSVLLSTGIGFGAAQAWTGLPTGATIVAAGDVNGDGLSDIAYQVIATFGFSSAPFNIGVAVSNGVGFTDLGVVSTQTLVCVQSNSPGCNKYDQAKVQLVDVSGDAAVDVLNINQIYLATLNTPPLLTTITSGNSVISATHNLLSTAGLYLPDNGAVYPFRDITSKYPIYVVSSATESDGVGGVVTTNYQYGGLKAHLRGRGSLGFRYVKESSPDSGISVTTFYRQDFPFIGLPSQVEKRRLSDSALLSVVQNTYANSDLATGTMISKFPYLSQSVEQAYELNGSLVSTTTTTNQYDGYGNVTSVSVGDGLGNIKTTTSTYNNDVGNWLLGRLIRSTVNSTTP